MIEAILAFLFGGLVALVCGGAALGAFLAWLWASEVEQ